MLLDTVGIRMLSTTSVRGESWYLLWSGRTVGRIGGQDGGGDIRGGIGWEVGSRSFGEISGDVDEDEEGPVIRVGGG